MRISDWSSDVCSSDLDLGLDAGVDELVGGYDTTVRIERIAHQHAEGGLRHPHLIHLGLGGQACLEANEDTAVLPPAREQSILHGIAIVDAHRGKIGRAHV